MASLLCYRTLGRWSLGTVQLTQPTRISSRISCPRANILSHVSINPSPSLCPLAGYPPFLFAHVGLPV
eukprot:scaffold275566_cov14-Tisochrysis_lutea.AAC.1